MLGEDIPLTLAAEMPPLFFCPLVRVGVVWDIFYKEIPKNPLIYPPMGINFPR